MDPPMSSPVPLLLADSMSIQITCVGLYYVMHTLADTGLIERKSVFKVSHQVRLKPNCLARVITVLPAKSDSDVMFCLQSDHGLIVDRSLVY